MKKLFFSFSVFSMLTFTVVSCSDNDSEDQMTLIEESHTPNPMDAYIPLESDDASSMKSVLGYGLDIMGEIGSYQSVKAQIIDLDRMDSEDPYSTVKVGTFQSFSRDLYGKNKNEYLAEMPYLFLDDRTLEQEELKGKILFTKGQSTYNFLSDGQNEYTYRSVHNYYLRYRCYYNGLTAKRYLKQSFVDDISSLSPQQIIEKYGTHVIAEYYDGIRFDLLYMAKIVPTRYNYKGEIITVDEDKRDAIKVGYYKAMVNSKCGSFNWESMPDNTDRLLKANVNPILLLNAVGGDPSIVTRGFFNLEKTSPDSHMSEWYATTHDLKNDELFKMVEVGELIPIYNYIKDPQKQEEVKKAVIEYISKNQPK